MKKRILARPDGATIERRSGQKKEQASGSSALSTLPNGKRRGEEKEVEGRDIVQ